MTAVKNAKESGEVTAAIAADSVGSGGDAGREQAIGRVVVVGAGVSGCACAARLAAQRAQVILVSSALDVVGIPGYGPELWGGASGWRGISAVLSRLPRELRSAWLNTASVPGSGEPLVVVDRRAVSIESKLALDRSPWVRFRQGLVEEIRRGRSPSCADHAVAGRRDSLEVETAFGEVFRADGVVLAPGLALHGRSQVGEDEMLGGRRGEVPADRLCAVLEELGVGLTQTSLEVGPRYAGRSDVLLADAGEGFRMREVEQLPVRTLLSSGVGGAEVGKGDLGAAESEGAALEKALEALAEAVAPGCSGSPGERDAALAAWLAETAWSPEFPPAPHYPDVLRADVMMIEDVQVAPTAEAGGARGREHCPRFVARDGAATSEYYLSPGVVLRSGSGADFLQEGLVRPGYSVTARVVADVSETGCVPIPGLPGAEGLIRVIGRAAGTETYLQSLETGVVAADDLVRLLRAEGRG